MRDAEGQDGWAALLSSLCLLHCLMLPFGLALAPALFAFGGGVHLDAAWVHWALLLVAIPVSVHALLAGYRIHLLAWPTALATLGFATMVGGAMVHGSVGWEQAFTVLGGLLVAAAHGWNWRLRRRALLKT